MAASKVSYYPSDLEARHFWDRVQALDDSASRGVPAGFPDQVRSPLAWTGSEIQRNRDTWQLDLSVEDVDAVDQAVARFQAHHEDLSVISSKTFELPEPLCRRLVGVSGSVYNKNGFQLIRGLNPERYTRRENIIVYAGIASHIFPDRGFVDQSREAVVCHVVNVQGNGQGPVSTAPAFSNTPLSFHTDDCEIMGFYYVDMAARGGQTVLSSSLKTYNELAKNYPSALHILAEPWVMDTFKSHDKFPPRRGPLLQSTGADNILLRFSRYGITGWQRQRESRLPVPTQAQLDALDAVQFTAASHSFTVPAQKGDILFVNDMAIMHARRGFEEDGQVMKRHLMKMFFRDPEQQWHLPPSAEVQRIRVYGGNQEDGGRLEVWHMAHEEGLEEESPRNG